MKLNRINSFPLIFATAIAINAVPLVNVSLQDSQSVAVVSDHKPGGGPREPFNT